MTDALLRDVESGQGISVKLDASCRERLREICLADLSNGGRGIRNKVETNLLNPLARALFDASAKRGSSFEARSIEQGAITTLHLAEISAPGAAA